MDKSQKPSQRGSVLCVLLEINGGSVVAEVVGLVVLAVVHRHLSVWWWWQSSLSSCLVFKMGNPWVWCISEQIIL